MRILAEYSESGLSETLVNMRGADYRETPVDVITFIKDPRYLGKAWH